MVILVGESASGKSTIEKSLTKHHGFQKIISYTSRPARSGEIDGIDYHFISKEKFEELQAKNFFAEVGNYRGWLYGSSVDDCKKDGVVAVLTPHGFRQMKKYKELDIFSFYINIPRRDRMIKILQRGDEIEECYRRSLSDVGQFDGISDEVDFVITNDKYEKSPDEIAEYIVQAIDIKNGGC